jgi:TonB-linked SusC/RagA family outer membrane protein
MRKLQLLMAMLMLLFTTAFAQNRIVTGRVTDDKGDPVPFASVKVIGAKTGVSADENGYFKISVPPNAVLEFSATGSGTKQVTVSGQGDVINVTIAKVSTEMTAVVITTSLGIKRQAKELGYAASSLTNKVLTQGKSVNVQQALNGKVSGLSITTTNSGVFENSKMNIRGIRSLTGNNQPMLVVDGAPTPLGYLSSIPPDDIQDLTILKSAASAAIYGPDAVNGVIIVTTKKGGKKFSVTVSSTVEAARVAYFPKLQKTFGAGAGEVLDPYGNYGYVPYENQQYGPAFDGSIKEIGVHLEDGSVQIGPYSNLHYKDKVKFWNTGLTLQNSVSLTGEDFFLSVQDAKIKGLMPNDENRRTSFRFNGGKKAGSFSVNYGLNYVLQNYDVVNEAGFAGLFPSAYNGSIFFLIMQTPSNIPLLQYKDWQNYKFAQYSNYYNEFAVNPYWVIDNIRQHGREDDFIGNVDASYQFANWLKATARVSTNLTFTNFQNTTAPIVTSDWAVANRNSTQYFNKPGSVFNDEAFTSRINLDLFFSGDAVINRDFKLKYIAGTMIRQNRSKDVAVGGNDLVVPYLYNVSVRSGEAVTPLFPNNSDIQSRLYSAYGSASLGFRDWAFLEVTGRNDWDSRLLKENRSFFYPGANASVVLSDAIPAIKSNSVSYAKIRAAISKSGNVNVPVYALDATYTQPAGFPFGNSAGFTANNVIPNPDLKPEFVITSEAGLELGFLKNRISVEGTYFNQTCNNQILQVSQSSTTGYTVGLANAASFKNYGVEADLGLTPLVKIGKGKIDLKMNATYNNNEVISTLGNIPVVIGGNNQFIQLAGGSPTANNIAVVGKPAFAFQLTDYARDSLGRVIVDATTGMPSQATQLAVMGRSLPLWVMGITPTYSIGGFTASMTWDYKTGHNFYTGMGSDEDFAGISARSAEYGRQRFVFPNSVYWDGSKYVENKNIQVQDGNAGFWSVGAVNTSIGTNYFASAAAWRLREVNISYNLPDRWIGNGKVIKRITVSAVGKNLLLLVPKSNQWGDPEFNSATGANTFGLSSSFQSPASRLFGGSVTVQF